MIGVIKIVPPAPVKVKAAEPRPAQEQTRTQKETEPQVAKPAVVKQAKPKPEPEEKAVAAKPARVFAPVEPPPSPISSAKEARLAELLRKYKADEITPQQYHEQRAKILAEP